MILILICVGLVLWVLYMGVNFYRSADWDEPAESSPDFAEMRKKEAQLLHIQDVLQEACDAGKLSKSALEEYTRYADTEIAQMKTIQKDWSQRLGDVLK
jgi:hypothetical protein